MTKRNANQLDMFATTFEDLPLFSGVAARAQEEVFAPQPADKQETVPGFERDWQETKRVLDSKRRPNRPADICPNGHPARYRVAFGSWDCKVCEKGKGK